MPVPRLLRCPSRISGVTGRLRAVSIALLVSRDVNSIAIRRTTITCVPSTHVAAVVAIILGVIPDATSRRTGGLGIKAGSATTLFRSFAMHDLARSVIGTGSTCHVVAVVFGSLAFFGTLIITYRVSRYGASLCALGAAITSSTAGVVR